jgi:hypothetical protein
MSVDWTQGFKVESDGTVAGTKIYDKDGEEVLDLQSFYLIFQSDHTELHISATFGRLEPPPGE